MSDLISRQTAIDVVSKYNFDFPQYMERFVTELRDAMKADLKHDIQALPSADVVEVVRCKDCIHCADDWNGNQPMFTCELSRCGESVLPNDFCSYAV